MGWGREHTYREAPKDVPTGVFTHLCCLAARPGGWCSSPAPRSSPRRCSSMSAAEEERALRSGPAANIRTALQHDGPDHLGLCLKERAPHSGPATRSSCCPSASRRSSTSCGAARLSTNERGGPKKQNGQVATNSGRVPVRVCRHPVPSLALQSAWLYSASGEYGPLV